MLPYLKAAGAARRDHALPARLGQVIQLPRQAATLACKNQRAMSHITRTSRGERRRRWYRDPTLPVPRTEITRFPHGVLEVKLSLPEGQKAPDWVQDLLDSGYLTEVCGRIAKRPQTVRCFAQAAGMRWWTETHFFGQHLNM